MAETASARMLARAADFELVVRQAGPERWMVQCPAHKDRTPSLSVRQIRGLVLVHCFAGCVKEDVVRALGLRMADLFDDPRGVSYPY